MAKLKLILSVAAAAVILVSCSGTPGSPISVIPAQPQKGVDAAPVVATTPQISKKQTLLSPPLTDAAARVTKKTFGMYVSPKNSPVSPEKFQGYHTGVDFETFAVEQDTDVAVSAVCAGPLLMKKWATGYGGVAVQQCKIDGQDVTVVYGHLKLSSILPKAHDQIQAGETFAVLGKGFSQETDRERKHLHLGIHRGLAISILGYVQSQSALGQWLDPLKYF